MLMVEFLHRIWSPELKRNRDGLLLCSTDVEEIRRGLTAWDSNAESLAPELSSMSNRLRDFHRCRFAHFMGEVFAQRDRMIGVDARIKAGAGY